MSEIRLMENESYVHDGKIYYRLPAKFLWSLTSNDGPMTGIAEYQGQLYYACCHQSPETRSIRWFWLYPLTNKEARLERKCQRYRRRHFGLSNEYKKDGKTQGPDPRTACEWVWEFLRILWPSDLKDYLDYRRKLMGDRSYKETEGRYLRRQAIGFFSPYAG